MNNSKIRLVNENEDIIVNEPDALVIKKHEYYFCVDALKNGQTFVMSRYNTYEDAKEIFDTIAQMIASKVEGYENFKVISQEKKDEAERLAEKICNVVHDEEAKEEIKWIKGLLKVLKDETEDEDEDD